MPYCAISDVNGLVPQQPFTSTTIPSQTQVETFIADIAVEMDSLLRLSGYVVPVTGGATALALLRNANKWGALGIAQDARFSGAMRDDLVAGGRNVWTQRYVEWKKSVSDPKVFYDLVDAARTGKAIIKPSGAVESDTTQGVEGYDYLSNPPFRIGMKL